MSMNKDDSIVKMRTALLKATMVKNLSSDTQMVISEQFIGLTDEEAEERASQILDIVNASKTESEILLIIQKYKAI